MLILRGTTQELEAAKQLLEAIDRPASQVMLSAFVLTGSDDDNGNASKEISDALRALLPYASYQVQAQSVVRVAAQPQKRFQIDLQGPELHTGHRATYQLQGVIDAYDPQSQALTF